MRGTAGAGVAVADVVGIVDIGVGSVGTVCTGKGALVCADQEEKRQTAAVPLLLVLLMVVVDVGIVVVPVASV